MQWRITRRKYVHKLNLTNKMRHFMPKNQSLTTEKVFENVFGNNYNFASHKNSLNVY